MIKHKLTDSLRDAMPLSRASDYIPGNPHVATLWRWVAKGVRGCKLNVIRVGGRTMVTPDAIETFLAALNAADEPQTPELTTGQRRRQSVAARQALEEIGI
jgi:hypothetical protein